MCNFVAVSRFNLMKNIGIKLTIILLFLVSACNSNPEGVVSIDKMAEILADLKVLEAKIDNFYVTTADSSRVAYRYEQNKIFKKHEIDSVQFNLSYDYYLRDKRKMLKVYEKSEEILENRYLETQEDPDEIRSNNPHLQRVRKH